MSVVGGHQGPGVPEAAIAAQIEIEDLIASSFESDALGRLQDCVVNFAPSLSDVVMDLRRRFEALRAAGPRVNQDPTELNNIRNEILTLAYDAVDLAAKRAVSPPARPAPRHVAKPADQSTPITLLDAGSPDPISPVKAPKRKKPAPPEPETDPDVVCRVREVSRKYARGQFSLDPISVDVRRGEIIAVAGRNASGKTTLLRMISGDLRPTTGSIEYPALQGGRGSRVRNWRTIKRQIASVPQLPEKWYGQLRHNLQYIAAVYGSADQDLRKFVEWNLARYEMYRFRNSQWDEISGGYKIRFELVRALLSQPKLLVLDEPLAYLDVVARDRFLKDIRAIADSVENPIPIVITSQHLSEIEAVADKIILIDDGSLKYLGRVDDISAASRFRVLEVAVDATKSAVETSLAGLALHGIEATVEGYLLAFPKENKVSDVFVRLSAAFGDGFTMMRDITGSVRALMSDIGR